ncbi:MAG: UpxY family transcription antiterminator [Colwellia sp.]|nr:UpxY family transcription antiterminator [Colwellia sp.]
MITEKDKQWYVIYTKPNAEKKLCNEVCKHQIDAYLPLRKETRQWSDRSKIITLPVFKSYLFVYLNIADMHTVKTLPGFVHFISFGGYPTPIPDKEMVLLKAIMTESNNPQIRATALIKGDRVKLFKGALAGYEGILCQDQAGQKVALEIKKLNLSLLVDVPIANVIKINHPECNVKSLTATANDKREKPSKI